MKIQVKIAKWVLIISLPALLLTASIAWTVNSLWVYQSGFERHNISLNTNLTDLELQVVARGLIRYFNSSEEYINLTIKKNSQSFQLLNEKEVEHLRDVKELIRLDYKVLLWTFIYALSYIGISFFWKKDRYRLAQGVFIGSVLTFLLAAALWIGTLSDFDHMFLQFHFISFTNDLWMLDPTKDYLIMLFPRDFWYEAALLCGGVTAGLAIILGGLSCGYLVVKKNKT